MTANVEVPRDALAGVIASIRTMQLTTGRGGDDFEANLAQLDAALGPAAWCPRCGKTAPVEKIGQPCGRVMTGGICTSRFKARR